MTLISFFRHRLDFRFEKEEKENRNGIYTALAPALVTAGNQTFFNGPPCWQSIHFAADKGIPLFGKHHRARAHKWFGLPDLSEDIMPS